MSNKSNRLFKIKYYVPLTNESYQEFINIGQEIICDKQEI